MGSSKFLFVRNNFLYYHYIKCFNLQKYCLENLFVLFRKIPHRHCKGKFIRQICHLSIEDLKAIDKQNRMPDGRPNCFIANKFDFNVDSGAIICMARRLHSQEYVRENLLH